MRIKPKLISRAHKVPCLVPGFYLTLRSRFSDCHSDSQLTAFAPVISSGDPFLEITVLVATVPSDLSLNVTFPVLLHNSTFFKFCIWSWMQYFQVFQSGKDVPAGMGDLRKWCPNLNHVPIKKLCAMCMTSKSHWGKG